MILRSIHLQGWRTFFDPASVGPFSEGLNVLHSPNAVGKSTLFEALRRGLLDSHKVSGKEVEAMRPWGRSLTPSVTVEFSHEDFEYRITKRFLDRPSSLLERKEGGKFSRLAEGDAADEQVRRILTPNPPGRGLARPENWGLAQILWAPQGDLAFSKLSDDLVSTIRGFLGAQTSGPESGHLEDLIEKKYLLYYTTGGKLKSGKDAAPIVKLKEQFEEASRRCQEARDRQRLFEQTVRRIEDLRANRAQAKLFAEEITKALGETRARSESYKKLLADKSNKEERSKADESRHKELDQRIASIRKTREQLKLNRDKLHGLRTERPLREKEAGEREKEALEAKLRLEGIRKRRKKVSETKEEADEARSFLDAKAEVSRMESLLQKINKANQTLQKRKQERASVIAPDGKTLKAIRKVASELEEAKVQLDAALITIEVVPKKKGYLKILVGEETGKMAMTPGKPIVVQGSPEVVLDIEGTARFRARGPAGSVEELREKRDEVTRKLAQLTKGFGTTHLDDLESLAEKAQALDKKVSETETQLETLLSGESVEAIDQAAKKGSKALQEILGRHPQWKNITPDAPGLKEEARRVERIFIENVESAEAENDTAQAAFSAVRERMALLNGSFNEIEKQIKSLEADLTDLTQDGKSDDERAGDLKKIAISWEASRALLEQVEVKLKGFGGDPGEAISKLEKQLKAADENATKALEEEKTEEGRLAQVLGEGPYSALTKAEEEISMLKDEIGREDVRMKAIQLLRSLVTQSQAEIMEAVAKPVEVAATMMMQRIAGGRLGNIRLGENLEPRQVHPEAAEAPVSLEELSGGEREQLFLATRLALAEVLAKYKRQLVVLDDVLMATDTGRFARSMSVLEDMAQRLQVLLLTCHPERYRGLNKAQFIDLEAHLRNEG